ncbi:hypothetical protein [Labrys neptuniae]
MMAKYAMSRWFANGAGHVIRFHNSDLLLFNWNGRNDGAARHIEHVNRYSRNGVEHKSLAALLRAVEAEHAETAP